MAVHSQLKVVINPEFSPTTQQRLATAGDALGKIFKERFERAASINVNLPSNTAIASAGATAGQAYAQAFQASATINIPTPPSQNTSGAGSQAGRQYADAFERTLQENLRKAMASLPDATIHINDAAAKAKIDDIRARMENLARDDIRVSMDAGQITAEIAAIDAELQALRSTGNLTIDVDLDVAGAMGHLAMLQAAIHNTASSSSQNAGATAGNTFMQAFITQINVMTANAQQSAGTMMSGLIQPISPATIGSFVTMAAAIGLIGAAILALIPILAVLVAGLGGLLAIAVAVGAGIAVLAAAFIPLIKQYTELEQKKTAATQASEKLKSAQEQEKQAVESLASAQENLAQTRADAAANERKAIDGLAKARAQAHQADLDATKQVTQAQNNLSQVRADAARATIDSSKRVADARAEEAAAITQADEAIREAEANQARVAQENAESIATAKQRVSDAMASSAASIAAADKRVADAEKTLQDAQRASLDIGKKISEQRQQDKRDLEDLNNQIKENALDQLDASAKLQAAQAELSRARGTGDGAAIGAAQRDVARAQLAVDENKNKGGDLKDARTELLTKGSKQLQALREQEKRQLETIKAAEDSLRDTRAQATATQVQAQRQVQDAQRALVKAQEDASRREEEATKRLTDAREAANKAAIDGNARVQAAQEAASRSQESSARSIAQAEDAIAQARENQSRVATQGAEQVKAAQENVATAQVRGAEQVKAATAQVQKATSNLSQAHHDVAAAAATAREKQLEATKGLTPAVSGFFATLKEAASQWGAVGRAAQDQMLPKISTAMQKLQPLIQPLSDFAGKVGGLFGDLAVQAANALTGPWWSQWGNDMGPRIIDILGKMGKSFGNIITGIAGIAQAFMPLGQDMAGGLQGGSKAFADWGKKLKDDPNFKAFIDYVKKEAPVVGGILKDTFNFLKKFFEAGSGPGAGMLDGIKSGFDALAKIDVDKLRKQIEDFANAVSSVVRFLRDWGPTIATAVGALIGLRVAMTLLQPVILLVRGAMWLFSSSATGAAGGASRFSQMLTRLRGGLSSTLGVARNLANGGLNLLRNGFSMVRGAASSLLSGGINVLSRGLGALRGVMTILSNGAVSLLTRGLGMLRTGITVATTAFRILSGVMRANPIGLVITVVMGLVSALTWFFTKTETGRKAWNAIVDAFKSGIKWITDNWHKPFDAIGNFFSKTLPKLKDDAVNVIGDLLGAAGRKIGDVGKWAQNTFVKPFSSAWEKIKGIFDWTKIFKDFNIEEILKKVPGGGTTIKVLKGLHLMNQGGFVPEPAYAMGGMLPRYADGGMITGPWLGKAADNVLAINNAGKAVARVNPGEFIIKYDAVQAILGALGPGFLNWLNNFDSHRGAGFTPTYAGGGTVATPTRIQHFTTADIPRYAMGGSVAAASFTPFSPIGGTGAIDAMNARIGALENNLATAVDAITSRPVQVSIDGRTFATVVNDASKNYKRGNR